VSTHLNPEELVDLAEGTRAESSASHLAACEGCRRQLEELRTMMAAMAGEGVPEPSPLFWDHLQQRVVDAVAADGVPARFPRLAWLTRPRVLVPIGALAAAALAIAVSIGSRVSPPPLPPSPGDRPVQVASVPADAPDASSRLELLNDSLADDDPSLQLVADLTAGMDSSAAGDAGLAVRGSAEHAVTHLNAAELSELQRILRQEIAKAGA
jgi:hypothetical protein